VDKNIVQLLRTTFEEWQKDNAARLAASLAYYAMFSIAPLLVIAIGIAGLVLGREQAHGQLLAQLSEVVGPDAAEAIGSLVQNTNIQTASVLATVIGVFTLLMGATGVFGELQASLNEIWDVKPKAAKDFGAGVLGLIKTRLVSLAMVLGIGLLLLITLIASAALAGLARRVLGEEFATVGQVSNFLLSFAVTVIMFAALYRVLPDLKIAWRDVWVGAMFTALLFSIGRLLIGLYLGLSSGTSVFGAAASLVVLLIWIYYSAQIFFFGGEFTQVYARSRGTRRGEKHLLNAPAAREAIPTVEPELDHASVGRKTPQATPAHMPDVPARKSRAETASPMGWMAALAIFGCLIVVGALSARRWPATSADQLGAKRD
jgi:membrane protein